jgi:uncharacterized oligopeptide transporter (OPT) family protein
VWATLMVFAGLTDIGMGTVFAKVAIIMCSLWSDSVITAIVAGSLVWMCLSQAGDLMQASASCIGYPDASVHYANLFAQDFKTAKLTGVSPRHMFVAQMIGALSSPIWLVPRPRARSAHAHS